MAMLKKAKMNQMAKYFLLLLTFVLTSCASELKELGPSLEYQNTATTAYGVGLGNSFDSAVEDGIIRLIQALSVEVSSEYMSLSKVDNKGSLSTTFLKNIIEMRQTYIHDYDIEKVVKRNGHYLVVVAVDKARLAQSLESSIKDYVIKLEAKREFLQRDTEQTNVIYEIEKLKQSIDYIKVITYWQSLLSALGVTHPYTYQGADLNQQLKDKIAGVNLIFWQKKMSPVNASRIETLIDPHINPNIVNQYVQWDKFWNNADFSKDRNNVVIALTSCAQLYSATKEIGFKGEKQVHVFRGCFSVDVRDHHNKIVFSKTVKDKRINSWDESGVYASSNVNDNNFRKSAINTSFSGEGVQQGVEEILVDLKQNSKTQFLMR